MSETKSYAQSQVLRCAATIRPSYCEYQGNKCCFSCDKNTDCMKKALRDGLMKPCRANIPVNMQDGSQVSVSLFDEDTRCEFSI